MKSISLILLITLYMLFGCSKRTNQLDLTFDKSIISSDVRISMEVLASVPLTEIYDGNKKLEIPNGYGENEWYFSYKSSFKGYLRHFKINRNNTHQYSFYIYEKEGKKFVDVNIKGDSPLKKTVELK